jgi:hypothetical protein
MEKKNRSNERSRIQLIGRLKPGKKEDKNEVTEPVFHCAKL